MSQACSCCQQLIAPPQHWSHCGQPVLPIIISNAQNYRPEGLGSPCLRAIEHAVQGFSIGEAAAAAQLQLNAWKAERPRSHRRLRVRERSLRYGLWQHQRLDLSFDGAEIRTAEGTARMADAWRAWRMAGFVLTRWQMQLFSRAEVLNN